MPSVSPQLASPAGPFPLPLPSQVAMAQRGTKQVSSLLTRDASDFMPGFSQRVFPSVPVATYGPSWVDGTSSFGTVAFAIYRFDLTARSGKLTLHTKFSKNPYDFKLLWLGVSNWEHDRWDWLSGADKGVTAVADEWTSRYRRDGTGEVYVAVVLLGTTGAFLQRLWLECSKRGDWWMYGRNATHQACSPFKGPDYPNVLWHTAISLHEAQFEQMSPVYDSDGNLYVFSSAGITDTKLFSVNSDGNINWEVTLSNTANVSTSYNSPKCSPALDDDGTIYAAPGRSGVPLYAITADGKVKWSYGGYGHISSQPSIGPGRTIYISDVKDDGSTETAKSYLHALNVNGSQLWEVELDAEPKCGGVLAAPDGAVYISDGTTLYSYTSSGAPRWTFASTTGISRQLALDAQGRICGVCPDGAVVAVNTDGTEAWRAEASANPAGAVSIGADGSLFFAGADNRLYSYTSGGAPRWSFPLDGYSEFCVSDASGTVFTTSQNGWLYAINADGTLKWWLALPYAVFHHPVIGEDGTLYAMTNDGMLYAIGPGSALPEYAASGCVKDENTDAGIAGATVCITGEEAVVTDAAGNWRATGLAPGEYLVSPVKDGYRFKPGLVQVSVVDADIAVTDIAGAPLSEPVWQMPGMDRAHTRRSPHTGPAAPDVLWSVRYMSARFYDDPVINALGHVCLSAGGMDGGVYCLNPDGTERWRNATARYGSLALSAQDGAIFCGASFAMTAEGVFIWAREHDNFTQCTLTAADC